MDQPFHPDDLSAWAVDLPAQIVTHASGLVVQVAPDALFEDKWTGHCLNARIWADKDFDARAHHLPRLLRAALAAYDAAYRKSCGRIH